MGEPLKGKRKCIEEIHKKYDDLGMQEAIDYKIDYFEDKSIKSAIEYLKEKICIHFGCTKKVGKGSILFKIINESFEDVIKK